MFDGILFDVSAAVVTYLIHSTIWLGGAWLVTRLLRAPAVREWTWRAAVCGGLVTAALYGRFGSATPLSVPLPSPAPALAGAAPAPAQTVNVALEGAAPRAENVAGDVSAPRAGAGATFPAWRWYHGAALLWALGALVGLAHLGWLHVRLRRALAGRREVDHAGLLAALDGLRADAGFGGPVRLTVCAQLGSPIALGRREICLPERALTGLAPREQASMLAHELAHLARRDSTWLAGQALLERLLFFQPLNRLAARQLEETAELLCDAQAVRWTGERTALARCLGRVAEWGARASSPLAAGMVRRASPLVTRIERVLAGGGEAPARAQTVLACTWTALAAVVLACQGPGVARQKGPPADDHPPQVAFVDGEPTELRVVVPATRDDADEDWAVMDAQVRRLVAEHLQGGGRTQFEKALRALVEEQMRAELVATGSMRVLNGTLLVFDERVEWAHRETGTVTSGIVVSSFPRQVGGVAKIEPDLPPTIVAVAADGSVQVTIETPVEGTPGATMATGGQVSPGGEFAERMHRFLKLAADSMPKARLDPSDESSPELPAGRLVLRVDPAADFGLVLTILEACAAEDVQIWNVSFELPGDEGDEGEIATPLPRDLPIVKGDTPMRIGLRIDVAEAGTKVDAESGEPWSGKGPFRFEGRELIYSVFTPHATDPNRGLGVAMGSVGAVAKVLEQKRDELPGAVLTIDARPGVVYEDVAGVVAAARELELPLRFVGRKGDK